MIAVRDLRKTYMVPRRAAGLAASARALLRRERDAVEALRGVSFDVAEGEIVGYIGPNGAGKSTTIKALCGILVPDSGECRVAGRVPWKERRAHVAGIGVVFGQRCQLWWDVPVLDSLELLREIYRLPRAEYDRNLAELVEALGIGPQLGQSARSLSLGQRMRCELAASLLHAPRVLFLDEPTIGLDATAKLAVRAFVRRINAERGVTVLLTTHDMHDVEALAPRVILIGKGLVLHDGPLAALRAGRSPSIEEAVAELYEEHEL